jgi:hypothetical protein
MANFLSESPQRKSIIGEEATFNVRLTNPGNVDMDLAAFWLKLLYNSSTPLPVECSPI